MAYTVSPEPFASLTNIQVAGQLVEEAIHAPDGETAAIEIYQATIQLQRAVDYWSQLGSNTANIMRIQTERVRDALIQFQYDAENMYITDETLEHFQARLYAFQATLGKLYEDTLALSTGDYGNASVVPKVLVGVGVLALFGIGLAASRRY